MGRAQARSAPAPADPGHCGAGADPGGVLRHAFSNRAQRAAVLEKYGEPGVVPQELTICDMAKPVVTKSEEKEGITYFTLESRVEKCEHSEATVPGRTVGTSSEIPADTVQVYRVGWKGGRIISREFLGATGARYVSACLPLV